MNTQNLHTLGAFAVTAALAATIAGCGSGSDPTFNVAVIGDSPYGAAYGDTVQLKANPAFIAALNADSSLSLALHVGDLHSGKEFCTVAYNQTIADQWKAFRLPVLYSPGDNEWADCHKVKQGGGSYNATTDQIDYVTTDGGSYAKGDPMANLALIRSLFFPIPGKSQGVSIDVRSQAREFDAAYPDDAQFVEHVLLERSGIVFVTLNIPGGSNNDNDVWYGTPTMTAAQTQEVASRTAAVLRWLDFAFARATAAGARGVVIQAQADMWDQDGVSKAHLTQYMPFVDRIAANATAFGKPVLLVHGDSHNYRTDNPLVPGAPCFVEAPATPGVGGALGKAGSAVACSDPAVASVAATYHKDSPGTTDPYANQPGGYNVPNFRRIVLHTNATTALEYLRLQIQPGVTNPSTATSFGPFSWTRVVP